MKSRFFFLILLFISVTSIIAEVEPIKLTLVERKLDHYKFAVTNQLDKGIDIKRIEGD
jgi:hypothetical protein